jgi:hypothetical protein
MKTKDLKMSIALSGIFKHSTTKEGSPAIEMQASTASTVSEIVNVASLQGIGLAFSEMALRKTSNSVDDYGVESSWGDVVLIGLGSGFISAVLDQAFIQPYLGYTRNLSVTNPDSDESKKAIKDFESAYSEDEKTLPGIKYPIINKTLNRCIALANGYHGYKRHNDNLAWGLGWAITTAMGVSNLGLSCAQGFAKPLPDEKTNIIHNTNRKFSR